MAKGKDVRGTEKHGIERRSVLLQRVAALPNDFRPDCRTEILDPGYLSKT